MTRRRLPMGYVSDDHRFTRGAGAIAAFDAVSPPRRRGLGTFTRGALGMINDDTRYDSGGGTAPRPPRPPRPKGVAIGQVIPTHVKYPGVRRPPAVFPPKTSGALSATLIGTRRPSIMTFPVHTLPTAGVRPPTVTGGGGGSGVSSPVMDIPEALEPEIDEFQDIVETPPTPPPASDSSSRTLMIAAALGGLYLLLRK